MGASDLAETRPSVTVHDLLRLALPLGSSIVAGQAGALRRVVSVQVLRGRPVALGTLGPGVLVVVSPGAPTLLRDEATLARLMTDLASAGAQAFALFHSPSEDLRRAADSLQTPLILLPAGATSEEVERRVVGLLMDHREHVHRRVEEVYERLLANLTEEDGANRLVSEIRGVTGKAAYVLDPYFQPLAGAGLRAEAELPALRRRLARDADSLARREQPFFRLDLSAQGFPGTALVRRLELRGAEAGFLCLLGPESDFTDFDSRLAERAASVLVIELAKQQAVAEARYRSQGDFVDDLLHGRFATGETLVNRARLLGYDLARPYLVFTVAAVASDDDLALSRLRQRLPDALRNDLYRSEPAAMLYQEEGRVTVLAPRHERDATAESAWVDQFRERLSTALEGWPVAAGIGRSPRSVQHFPTAYRESVVALEVALTLLGGDLTVAFQDLGVHRLLFHLLGQPELDAYRQDYLGALERYDARHRTELVQTLEALLDCHGNHARAAQRLHLHRNTLQYRLERIRALLGRDIDDPETRLALHMALKIRRVLSRPSLDSRRAEEHNSSPSARPALHNPAQPTEERRR